MKKPYQIKALAALLAYSLGFLTYAQELAYAQESDDIDLLSLSLEELMNMTIVSASKKEESVFEAPLSSYSITREEIVNSGATSIPEALRLSPGVIVREYNNGNYDVHLRGFDNPARYVAPLAQRNSLTLVMINDRPVFNYNYGLTVWENLPVDLIDIERIEIVRGPSAPLFGPNAVTGVINIITQKPGANEGLDVSGSAQYGSEDSFISGLSISNRFNEKLSLSVSGNYQTRDRHDEVYYSGPLDDYFPAPIAFSGQLVEISDDDKSFALERKGINGFLSYEEEDFGIDLSGGYQEGRSQSPFLTNSLPTISNGYSYYTYLRSTYKDISANVSVTSGKDELAEDLPGDLQFADEYDYTVINGNLDYTFNLLDSKLEVVPAFNYQYAVYDDRDYIDGEPLGGLLNAKQSISLVGGGLRVEYLPVEKLRLISALRYDSYDVPDDEYLSYQFIATYSASDNLLLRVVHAKSNNSSFVLNSFQNVSIQTQVNEFTAVGSETLDLGTNTMTEIGLRWQLLENLQLDWSGFYQELKDFSVLATISSTFDPATQFSTVRQEYANLGITQKQIGSTLSMNWVPNNNLLIKPYITIQHTNSDGIDEVFSDGSGETLGEEHESTPNVYGGAYMSFNFNKLNIALSPYFFGKQRIYLDQDLARESEEGGIDATLILNAKVSYEVMDQVKVFFNARNIGSSSSQYYGTGEINAVYLGGLSYNF